MTVCRKDSSEERPRVREEVWKSLTTVIEKCWETRQKVQASSRSNIRIEKELEPVFQIYLNDGAKDPSFIALFRTARRMIA